MKLIKLFTMTTLTVSILAGCGGEDSTSGTESGFEEGSQIVKDTLHSTVTSSSDANAESNIKRTDIKFTKVTETKASQLNIPNIPTKAIRSTKKPMQTPVMFVERPLAPVTISQATPVVSEGTIPATPMTVISSSAAKPVAQSKPDSMPMQQAVMSAPQMVSIEAPKPMVQSAPVSNEWAVLTDTSLMSETIDFDSLAYITQEIPQELPSATQTSGDIVSDFAMAQVTSEFETAVDNVNYLKDIVKSIVDQATSHSNGHGNGVQVSHITLESGESLTIKVKHDGQTIEVTLDQSGHGHSQSVVLTGSLDYEPYTGAYTLMADFQDVTSLGITSVPSISSTIAGTYYNDNFYDIEVRNYNDQFEYGVVYIDGEGNPYMAYATHLGLDVNVEYRSQTI